MNAEHEWLSKEEKEIQEEIRSGKKYPKKHRMLMVYVLIYFLFGSVLAYQTPVDQSYLYKKSVKMRGVFGDTWICKNCGYENYEGINRCGICGERK